MPHPLAAWRRSRGGTGAARPHERRLGGGLDVSYRFAQVYSIFAQAQVMYSNNRDFVAGDNGFDGLVLVELTRSFR